MIHATINVDSLVDDLIHIEALRISKKYVDQHGYDSGLKEFSENQALKRLTTLN